MRLSSAQRDIPSARRRAVAIPKGYGLADHVEIVNPVSGPALDADLNDAYERREPWLGYQWGTSGPALLLDLVRLEEPEYSDECWQTTMACAYEDSTILVGVNSSLPDLAPDVVEFLRQWDFSIGVHLRNVVRWLDANPGSSVEDAALHWLGSNVGVWSGWVTGEAAAGIRATLPAMDEDGTVTLSSMQPVVGTPLTANLTDPDGMVTGEMWQWARSMDMMDWEDIAGATMVSYTPVGSDEGV